MKHPLLHTVLALLPNRLVVGLATCGPVGRWGKAPGTNGSLVGVALYLIAFHNLPVLGQVVLGAALGGLAILICGEAERRLQKRDPGEIILDEIVGQPIALFALPAGLLGTPWAWVVLLLAFGLFRLFDIWKPWIIYRLQFVPGGSGVVLDDLAAGVVAWGVLQLLILGARSQGWIG